MLIRTATIILFALILITTGCSSREPDTKKPDDIKSEVLVTEAAPENSDGSEITGGEQDLLNEDSGTSENGTTETDTVQTSNGTGFNIITAAELTAAIRIGWSLGNTLDAHGGPEGFSHLGGGIYANTSVTELETGWGRPVTKKEHITAIKDAGFNAVRIPVTWYKACDADLNIRDDWMERIKEVAGYAVENDMYIIINTHHDEILYRLLDDEVEESKKALTKIWTQIAIAFNDYNEKLFFEGLGEPRTSGSPAEWRGGTEEEHKNLNILNQAFVDAVRNTGGNNAERVLMIPTYAASANEVAQRALTIPVDPAKDKIIVSLHFYEPWNFALRTGEGSVTDWNINNKLDTEPITRYIDLAYEIFVSKGIPVIIGEMGAINRDNTEARAAWTEFYTSYAKSKDIKCFWWDNGSYWVLRRREWGWEQTFGLLDREKIEIAHPEIIDALLRATS